MNLSISLETGNGDRIILTRGSRGTGVVQMSVNDRPTSIRLEREVRMELIEALKLLG